MARPPAPRVTGRTDQAARSGDPAHRGRPPREESHDEALTGEVVLDPDLRADDHADDPADTWTDLGDTAVIERAGGTSEHRAPRRWTVVEPEAAHRRTVPWGEAMRGARAGLEAVLLSWMFVVVPVVAAYVATVASPVLGEASWWDAARNASAGWLLGLGQEMVVPGADGATSVTLTPVALTLLTGGLLAARLRRARTRGWLGVLAAPAAAALVIVAVYSVVGVAPTTRALVTTALVLTVGTLLGAARVIDLPSRLPDRESVHAVLAGLRAGTLATLALLALGAVTAVAAVALRGGAVAEVHGALQPDALSTVVLVIAQLFALPTLAVWCLAWWSGPGFAIGTVTVDPTAVTAGPLPVVPVLAAVPDAGPGPGAWVVVVPAVVVVVTWLLVLARRTRDWRRVTVSLVVAAGVLTLLVGVAAALSGGAAGAQVGPLAGVGTVTSAVAVAVGQVAVIAAVVVGAVWYALLRWGSALTPHLERLPLGRRLVAALSAR